LPPRKVEPTLRTDRASLDHTSTASYTAQQDARSVNISSSNTPQSDYGLTPSSARSQNFPPEHLARYPQYHPAPHHQSAVGSMAQPASPSMSLQDAPPHDNRISNHMKSDPDVPIDPSIAQQQQQSPTYPPPYSPYNPQAHDMAQYQGHPPPGMYQPRPDGWGQYGHPGHMPGPYQSPATSVPNASPNVTAGGRPGQVCLNLEGFGSRGAPSLSCFAVISCHI
jgi:transcription factor CON7